MNTWIAIFLIAAPAFCQTPEAKPVFEVADIRPADPNSPMPRKGRILPGGRLEIAGMSAQDMILFAYGVQENAVTGLPAWASRDRYDLVAKAATTSSTETLRLMLQNLLADRLQLAIHREDKVMPVYVLKMGKHPLKMEKAPGGQMSCLWSNGEAGLRKRTCQNMPMAELAKALPAWGGIGINLPVLDQTGLEGAWNFEFEVGLTMADRDRARGPGNEKGAGTGELAAPNVDNGPTIFEAFEKLGLKLESRKESAPVMVVDKIEKPIDQ